MTLRVAIDIGPLRPPFTGVANFELFLLDALLSEQPSLVIEGFGRLSWTGVTRALLEDAASRAHKALRSSSPAASGLHHSASPDPSLLRIWKVIRRLDGVQRLLAGARQASFEFGSDLRRFDLFHAFAYCPPGRADIPVVPVVYDLSYQRYPQTHPPARLRAMEPLAAYIAKAPVVHTISEFTASEISAIFGVGRSRVIVTYPAAAPIFSSPLGAASAGILAGFGLLGGCYALTVATLEPRKNLRTLVDAFSRLPTAMRMQMPLCVVGAAGWGDLALPAPTRVLEREGSLRFLGYVPDAQLRGLYAGTRVMLYPSFYEGFGMPVIEAMACGAPVVASAGSSLPEAVGKFGRLVEPLDVDAWSAELLRAAASDREWCDEGARSARRAHALSFTWQGAAQATLQIYRRVTGS
jgi:glycosyltransferase involved in cell wall biosynthesis